MADAISLGEGVVGDLASRGAAEVVNDLDQRSAGGADPGFRGRRRGTSHGRPAPGSRPRDRDDGRLAFRAVRPLHRRGSQLPGRSLAAGGDRDRDRAPVPGDRSAEAVLRVTRRHQPGRSRHDGSRRGRVRLEPGGRAPVRVLGAGRDRAHDRLARDQVIRVRGRGSGDRPRGDGAGPRAPADPPDASRREVRRGRGRHRAARGRRRSPGLLRDLPRRDRAAGGSTQRRRRERGEERVPRDDEPRDPHADERDHRHERAVARYGPER